MPILSPSLAKHQTVVDVITTIIMIYFFIEIVIMCIVREGYAGGMYFFLDLIAAGSMFLDIQAFSDHIFYNNSGATSNSVEPGAIDLSVLRASRAAKAGSKAGRLIKVSPGLD